MFALIAAAILFKTQKVGANLSIMNDHRCIAQILDFWFGELDDNGMCDPARNKLWFQSSAAGDSYIRENFGPAVSQALKGDLDHWADQDEGLVALVLLLDQFTRNIHRDTPAAFSGDPAALALATTACESRRHESLPAIHRVFLYIPFEHSENLDSQHAGIECFDGLLSSCATAARERISGFRQYSVAHRDVIARFGRFPHRNAILDRESNDEEVEHLQTHGGF
jgi:uncharacterized protein (DUF924 family)